MNLLAVTGGCGYLGRKIVLNAIKSNLKVRVVDSKIYNTIKNKNVEYIKNDIKNINSIKKIFKGCKYVIHLAGLSDLDLAQSQPIKTFEDNIKGTINVLESCVANKVNKIIFSSTLYVTGDHGGFYSCSKKSCESYIEEYKRKFNLDYIILRFGSLYGEGSNISNGMHKIIYDTIKKNEVTYYGNPEASREYIHVNDAAKATVDLTLDKKFINQKINISGYNTVKVPELLEIIREMLKIKKKIKFIKSKTTGHYVRVPHSDEALPLKYTINPSVDFAEGLYHLIKKIKNDLKKKQA